MRSRCSCSTRAGPPARPPNLGELIGLEKTPRPSDKENFDKTFWGYDTYDYNPVENHAFAGQQDGLFREVGMKFKLTEQQIKVLNSSSKSSEVPLKALAVDFTLKLSDYGTVVKIQEPANAQPTKALGGALLGAFFSMTG